MEIIKKAAADSEEDTEKAMERAAKLWLSPKAAKRGRKDQESSEEDTGSDKTEPAETLEQQ